MQSTKCKNESAKYEGMSLSVTIYHLTLFSMTAIQLAINNECIKSLELKKHSETRQNISTRLRKRNNKRFLLYLAS